MRVLWNRKIRLLMKKDRSFFLHYPLFRLWDAEGATEYVGVYLYLSFAKIEYISVNCKCCFVFFYELPENYVKKP